MGNKLDQVRGGLVHEKMHREFLIDALHLLQEASGILYGFDGSAAWHDARKGWLEEYTKLRGEPFSTGGTEP